MASSGSSPESNRPHRRRDLGRTSRSRDTRHHTHIEEVDYDADENTPLPSINPPPGTEIARGVPDPPQPSDTVTGDNSHQTTTSPRAVSGPPSTPRPQFPFPRPHSTPAFPPSPPTHLTGPLFPPPRVQAPRPRPPLSHPRATGPPPHNPYAPRPCPRQPLSSRDHRTSRTTRSPLTRQFDRRRSHPRSRSAHSRRPREHRRRSPVTSRSRRDNHHSRRSQSRHRRSRTHNQETRELRTPQERLRSSNLPPTRSRSCHSSTHRGRLRTAHHTSLSAPRATSHLHVTLSVWPWLNCRLFFQKFQAPRGLLRFHNMNKSKPYRDRDLNQEFGS